jgi:histidinol phosphatase-like PHP family hydrolase
MLDHLDAITLGVTTARRAWLAKEQIVNTWTASRFAAWARRPREAARAAR